MGELGEWVVMDRIRILETITIEEIIKIFLFP